VNELEIWDSECSLERLANTALTRTPLSPRQREVLQAMSHGRTYPEAAAELGISIETVKEHLKIVRRRLGARNTNQAIADAIRLGLMP